MPLVTPSRDLKVWFTWCVSMKRKQNHTYPLEMGEVKVFGIHIRGRNPIDKSIRWTGLPYGRVATDREAADTLGCDGSYCDGHKQCDGASQA